MNKKQQTLNYRILARASQIQYYRLPISIVENWFKEKNIELQSDVWIYPIYPDIWDGVVAAKNRVWILRWERGKIHLRDIQPVKGFRLNGTLIFS